MCGLSGFIDSFAETSPENLTNLARRMGDTLCHRGPNDSGEWVDPEAGFGLGHRRLSISQPKVTSRCIRPVDDMSSRTTGRSTISRNSVKNWSNLITPSEGTRIPRSCWQPSASGAWRPPSPDSMACLPSHYGTATAELCT